ncbi:MAG: UDP-N-acetylmuramoyl-tripeptide--D-alanyl-D-alanine ligase [Candidatus Sungbacteria bacterium]|uniref:UDP-N-acetylmuramoyl-tripeptide--D-alanyl-D-alanine ligase n=1 Tax=Candidatus Sungiibacteriota bacterium TaxID=2750080 RepID=A0A9D6QTU3_9BACT|nr:UDP-N-acetylmuramoyl-tripeptide--D-alanyl-D-alanine ligase [Candidatus Sungbacteria bacterium]
MNLLIKILAVLSRIYCWRYDPKIIAITGNIGKTSTKDAIVTVLSSRFRVRGPEKNYNNEIGVPLTILGWHNSAKNIFGWFIQLLRLPLSLMLDSGVDILVLEMGADHPGDIDYLTKLARPDIGVLTAIGDLPVHAEFFASTDELVREKSLLVQRTDPLGHVFLNADDPKVCSMSALAKAAVHLVGEAAGAEFKVENIELRAHNNFPEGLSYKIRYRGLQIPIRLYGSLSRPQVLASAFAFAIGVIFRLNPIEIVERLKKYQLPPGRLKIIKGQNDSVILDDSYNAAPQAVLSALETLLSLPGRHIAVLGDMKELGAMSDMAHRRVGEKAKDCDLLFCVGANARIIAAAAVKNGLAEDRVFYFNASSEVSPALLSLLEAQDVVLVKGAQSMRMERVVKAIMAEPERASELLPRQNPEWLRIP